MNPPVISADSHVTEPPDAWDDVEPAYRDRVPRIHHVEGAGDVYVIDGIKTPIPLGIVAAAGKPPEQIRMMGTRFEDLHRGGWDPAARLLDQDRDGVAAEVIYPTVGMVLCNHPDPDYKKACFDAYNRWIAAYCAHAPERLLGVGQTAMRTPEEGIRDLEAMAALGLRGVMMPANPVVADYDAPEYDEFWEAAIEIGLPLAFHILTGRDFVTATRRGPKMNGFLAVIRGCQDIMGMLVLGGVFERHPRLRVVCVEADAGWVPHFMYRMDHAWKRHRNWLPAGQALTRLPSEWFASGIYTTFQDDWVAFRSVDMLDWHRLLWANDFPHSDSTWPWSQQMLAEHGAALTDEQRHAILSRNAAELYRVDLGALARVAPGGVGGRRGEVPWS